MSNPPKSRLVAVVAAVALLSGCRTFLHDWAEANEQPFDDQSVTGIWAGPWKDDRGRDGGYLQVVVAATQEGGYRAHAKVFAPHPLWSGATISTCDNRFELQLPLYVVAHDDGTYAISSQSQQLGYFVHPYDLTMEGTATGSEMSLDFERNNRSGRIRLKKLHPCPEQFYFSIPSFVAVSYEPDELRDQVESARRLALDDSPANATFRQDDLADGH